MMRVKTAPYTTAQFSAENHFGAEVKVLMKDGALFSRKVDEPLGRTVDNPLPPERLREKFERCAARVLKSADIAQLNALVEGYETLGDVRTLTKLACGDAAREASIRAAHA